MLIGFNSRDHFNLSTGKVHCFVLFRKNSPSREANFGREVMAPVDHQADIDAARSRPRLNAVATYEGLCSAD
jgi:hypothetical protein